MYIPDRISALLYKKMILARLSPIEAAELETWANRSPRKRKLVDTGIKPERIEKMQDAFSLMAEAKRKRDVYTVTYPVKWSWPWSKPRPPKPPSIRQTINEMTDIPKELRRRLKRIPRRKIELFLEEVSRIRDGYLLAHLASND